MKLGSHLICVGNLTDEFCIPHYRGGGEEAWPSGTEQAPRGLFSDEISPGGNHANHTRAVVLMSAELGNRTSPFKDRKIFKGLVIYAVTV